MKILLLLCLLIWLSLTWGYNSFFPETISQTTSPSPMKWLDYFRQQILDGETINFSEYFYNLPSLSNLATHKACDTTSCLFDMPDTKIMEIQGYFSLSPKEEYFLCTEMDDPTCFPPTTGVFNVEFVLTVGNDYFAKGEKLFVGCYDKQEQSILYQYEYISFKNAPPQYMYTAFLPEQVAAIVIHAQNNTEQIYQVVVPQTFQMPHLEPCWNRWFLNPVFIANV